MSWERSKTRRGKGILRSANPHAQRPRKYYLPHKHHKETLLTACDLINTRTEIWIEDEKTKRKWLIPEKLRRKTIQEKENAENPQL